MRQRGGPEPTAPAEADEADAQGAARLARAKRLATGLLAGCVALLLAARALSPAHPVFGYLAAFAEAAIIGALADWYAVVALFRHPLGVPLPHTAIIRRSQARIADSLGQFIETHFLAPEPIAARLAEIEFCAHAGRWLSDRQRNGAFVEAAVGMLPRVASAIEQTGLREALTQAAMARLRALDLAPVAAGVLETVTHDGRHQELLDAILGGLHRLLADEAVVATLREKVREQLPRMFNLFRADSYVLQRLLAAATTLLDEAQRDRDHPLRREFDAFTGRFIERLRSSPQHRDRIEALKQELLDRPEVAAFARDLWDRFGVWLARDIGAESSVVRRHAGELAAGLGRQLLDDAALRESIDRAVADALHGFVQRHKHRVSRFVTEQVQAWNAADLTRVVELNIGTDLQYIRVNGTVVGGLIGLGIYTVTRLVGL